MDTDRLRHATKWALLGCLGVGAILWGSCLLDMWLSGRGWSDPWYLPPGIGAIVGAVVGLVGGAIVGWLEY